MTTSKKTGACAGLVVALLAGLGALQAAEPFTAATVSRVENNVSYGKIIGDRSEMRPAAPNDVVAAMNFLLSEANSRAELKYEDGSIVRIGQNTIFTFEANTRTMNLKKGTFVFYVPKGKGGGTIKTPSFTAAITGTIGKVSDNLIAVIEGEITLVPSGQKVPEGFFARKNPDGTIEIKPFDRTKEFDGKLMTFNGPLPGLPERAFGNLAAFMEDAKILNSTDIAGNMPSNPKFKEAPPVKVKKDDDKKSTPKATPYQTPTPRRATPTPYPTPTPAPTSVPIPPFIPGI